ncbi:MAG: class I SAM-dependent methyltransferase [Phycisphaerales bacterium JB063]
MPDKSTVAQIRERFDHDVERFANLETGQTATMDAPLMLELVTQAAAGVSPQPARVLDIGCGAGNYTLKLLAQLPAGVPTPAVSLLDLSRPMLDRAAQRVADAGAPDIETIQGDVREVDLGERRYGIVLAAMVLHHLRSDAEWDAVFAKLYRSLAPGGSLWVADLVDHDDPAVRALMWERYGAYLETLGGPAYRAKVFAYIEQEDTPRSVSFQLEAMRRAGFARVQVLHKNACFAAIGGVRPAES